MIALSSLASISPGLRGGSTCVFAVKNSESFLELVKSFLIMLFGFGGPASHSLGFAQVLAHFVYLNY